MTPRRIIAVLVALVVVATIIVLILSLGGGDEPAPGPAPAKPPVDGMRGPIVIEMTIRATDTLPEAGTVLEPADDPGGQMVAIVDRDGPRLWLDPALQGVLAEGAVDGDLVVDPQVKDLASMGGVLLLTVERRGQGLWDERRTVRLHAGDPPPPTTPPVQPAYDVPPGRYPGPLLEVLAMPADFKWRVDGDRLIVSADGKEHELEPGGQLKLPARATAKVRLGELPPVAVGDVNFNPLPEVRWQELDAVEFVSEIEIHHHGRLPAWEDQP